ncbi:MAG TPA: cation:proton antiporter [Spongiibacteraceae bacterium]|nr:cation:proton antiporter [Spongiibacteraceae bacterium]
MIEATWIAFAFGLGLLARVIGLPPLIGYLGAGFALAAFDNQLGITRQDSEILAHLSHLGVLLLLFTVGLKLKLSNLARPEVVGGSLLHFGLSSVLMLPPILLFFDVSAYEALMLSVVLAFSSTVLAAKVLESRRELKAFHGRVAIGVLIMQDLIALLVMSLASGKVPSAWALLVFLLPLLRPLLFRLLDHSGHEELLVLLGLMMALVVGGLGFESVGLSSELGALAFGAMLAKHPRAGELSNSLWSVKEVFLVGFFLQIGIGGLPDIDALIFAAVMSLLLPLKTVLFFFLFLAFRLRSRSAFLSAASLTNYSEFGLIVMSVVMPQWLVPLAITVAFSFILSAQFNRVSASLYDPLDPAGARHPPPGRTAGVAG